MRRRTRKKRGGFVEGDAAPDAPEENEPEPPREYVIENTLANINSFRYSTFLVPDTDTPGFNAMIQEMRNNISRGGFWIVEWNQARDPDDTYHHFHLSHTYDLDYENLNTDHIRFVGSSGGRKKRKRKTRKKKRKKRRKKKTKRRRRKNKR